MYKCYCLSLVLALAFGACTTRQHHVPNLETAQSLRGRSLPEVKEALGEAADQDHANRAYWYLTEDNRYHPEPRVERYEFIFDKNRLIEIKLSK